MSTRQNFSKRDLSSGPRPGPPAVQLPIYSCTIYFILFFILSCYIQFNSTRDSTTQYGLAPREPRPFFFLNISYFGIAAATLKRYKQVDQ